MAMMANMDHIALEQQYRRHISIRPKTKRPPVRGQRAHGGSWKKKPARFFALSFLDPLGLISCGNSVSSHLKKEDFLRKNK
jgi:hypothetical protein